MAFKINNALFDEIIRPNNTKENEEAYSTNFTFPPRESRITYYMGHWYDRNLSPRDMPCREILTVGQVIGDRPVLFSAQQLDRLIRTNTKMV